MPSTSSTTQHTPGPVAEAVAGRPPFGPMEYLPADRLRAEQRATLGSPRRRASLSARALFAFMDLVYGRERTLEKFRVLELVARVPYQAWENVAYVAVTHTAREPGFARRVFDRVRISRWEQDNEQWHLLILEELLDNRSDTEPQRHGWFATRLLPQIMAFVYYQLSWVTYAIKPAWSYRLNADFEDHARSTSTHCSSMSIRGGRRRRSRAHSPTTSASTRRWPTCFARSATTSACTNCRARRR
jgi:ubiquinol oxidase